jgi:hypothetical protein
MRAVRSGVQCDDGVVVVPQTLMYLPTFTWVGAFPYYRVVDLVKWACSHLLAWEVRCGDMVDEESGTRMLH